jgi:hypothetical protein
VKREVDCEGRRGKRGGLIKSVLQPLPTVETSDRQLLQSRHSQSPFPPYVVPRPSPPSLTRQPTASVVDGPLLLVHRFSPKSPNRPLIWQPVQVSSSQPTFRRDSKDTRTVSARRFLACSPHCRPRRRPRGLWLPRSMASAQGRAI